MNNKKNIIFLIQSSPAWNCIASIYHEMKSRENLNPIVVTIPDINNGLEKIIFQDEKNKESIEESLDKLNIEYINFSILQKDQRLENLKKLNPVLIITSIKDNIRLLQTFNLDCFEFSQLFKTVYIPYYGSTQVEDPDLHTRGGGHKFYWKFIVDNKFYVDYFTSKGTNLEKIINLGHPKIEEIYKIRNLKSSWPLPNSENKLKIIWAPHWSCINFDKADVLYNNSSWEWKNTLKFGTFLINCWDFYDLAQSNLDKFQFVFRPHPMLSTWLKLNNHYYIFKEFYEKWSKLSNTYNQLGGLYNDVFAASDLLITDGISFLIEYPIATGKPLIFIDSGIHDKFNNVGLLGEKYSNKVTKFEEIVHLLNNKDELKTGNVNEMLDYLLPYRELTSVKITDALLKDLN